MNIIEAIKSGKNFKRKDWSTYLSYHDGHRFCCLDILADDWEIESTPVMITREKLSKAWEESFGWNEPYGALSFKCLAKELGL